MGQGWDGGLKSLEGWGLLSASQAKVSDPDSALRWAALEAAVGSCGRVLGDSSVPLGKP